MNIRRLKLSLLTLLLLTSYAASADKESAQKATDHRVTNIPKTWVDAELAEAEIPLADPIASPSHVSADYYYRIPERKIYKTYPVYAPAKEPLGYLDWLKQQEPEIVFDATKLKTEADWIRAGELVFETDTAIMAVTPNTFARNPALYEQTHRHYARGPLPFARM